MTQRKIKKWIINLVLTLLALITPTTSYSWEMMLTNTDATLTVGEFYTLDMVFQGDPTDNLNYFFLAVNYNTELVELVAIEYFDYDDDGVPVPNQIWNGNEIPHDAETDGLIYNIMGSEPLGNNGVFYPAQTGDTLMATLWFQAITSGPYTEIVTFTWSGLGEQVAVNEKIFSGPNYANTLILGADGSTVYAVATEDPPYIYGTSNQVNDSLNDVEIDFNGTLKGNIFYIRDFNGGPLTVSVDSSTVPEAFPVENIQLGCPSDLNVSEESECVVDDDGVLTINPDPGIEVELSYSLSPERDSKESSEITFKVSDEGGLEDSTAFLARVVTSSAPKLYGVYIDEPGPTDGGKDSVTLIPGSENDGVIGLVYCNDDSEDVAIYVSSSDIDLIDPENIVISLIEKDGDEKVNWIEASDGATSNRLHLPLQHGEYHYVNMVITPEADVSGTCELTLTACDITGGSGDTLTVTAVIDENHDPEFSDMDDFTLTAGVTSDIVALTLSDQDGGTLTLSVESQNTSLIPNKNILLGMSPDDLNSGDLNVDLAPGESKTIYGTITSADGVSGAVDIEASVSDGTTRVSQIFTVLITENSGSSNNGNSNESGGDDGGGGGCFIGSLREGGASHGR